MIPAAALSRMKILVVDDEPANVSLLRYILLAAGYDEVRTTTDARPGDTAVPGIPPDLILQDLMMPHLSGFEVMGSVGSRDHPRGLPADPGAHRRRDRCHQAQGFAGRAHPTS